MVETSTGFPVLHE